MLFQGSAHVAANEHFRSDPERRRSGQRVDLVRSHQLLRDAAGGEPRARPLAGVRPHGLPASGHDHGEARDAAPGGDERTAPARRQSAVRARRRAGVRAALPGRAPLQLAGDRDHGGHRGGDPRRRPRVLRHLVRPRQRRPHSRRRLRARGARWSWSSATSPRSRAAGRGRRARELPSRASGERFDVVTDRVKLERLYLAYVVPAYGTREWYAADLLAQIFAGGKASRLYRDLVHERELAQSITCYALPTEAAGSFHVVATARPGTSLDQLGRAVDEHLAAAAAAPACRGGDRAGEEPHPHRLLLGAPDAGSPRRPPVAVHHLLRSSRGRRRRDRDLPGARCRRDPGAGGAPRPGRSRPSMGRAGDRGPSPAPTGDGPAA